MYRQQQGSEKHYCDKSNCSTPSNLTHNQFCGNCCSQVGPRPVFDLKSEFVPITKKELAQRERLSLHFRQQLCYSYPPNTKQNIPHNYCPTSSAPWQSISDYQQQYPPRNYWDGRDNSVPLENESGQVLGYYRYVLLTGSSDSGSGGKLFWLMVIGAAVWFWFFR
ncbi:hypothetical protein [Microcoleus sp. PH2017_05_CCC_O_A]|uniref:hypothetical protein n=1 Tax=Microcoleus sp. PH2017_05_CCC_O_A TaxID=2798816 RepID=UPI001D3EF905|nr:hypothetical protein [Microcoleus sp. PH2017_05_CCC_O_A]MCC3439230.1 hypothetical protein [Microcoleus sp. PH2017_05_CCC_O_A]